MASGLISKGRGTTLLLHNNNNNNLSLYHKPMRSTPAI
jgi:hypothetical protein